MKLHINNTGSGEQPLVLLHGWGFHSAVWADLSERLGQDFNIYAVDLPGHGHSPLPRNRYTLQQTTAALAEQLPDNAILLGWSLGGVVAQMVAASYPDKVKALALIATSPRLLRASNWPNALTAKMLNDMAERLQADYDKTIREFVSLQLPGLAKYPSTRQLLDELTAKPPRARGLVTAQDWLEQQDLRSLGQQLHCPALFIYGDRDSLVPAKMATDWQQLWPQLQIAKITGAAHMPFLSHSEQFCEILLSFIKQTKTTSITRSSNMATRTANRKKPNPAAASNLKLDDKTLVQLYDTMHRIRAFDERVAELFHAGEIKGTAHSYVGQEAIAAGICANLSKDDFVASHHRGHGHCIAKGASMDQMMAELMGRETGYCRGLGGSMHIADMNLNILGANGIVGAAMPLSTGAALAAKLNGDNQVVVAFFGDGASNQGIFHESMNLASIWKLPLIFVCENNQYALTTSYRRTTSVEQISQRAVGYNVPGVTVDGNDVAEVYLVAQEAIDRARADEGPTLIEAMTYRWGQHSMRANLQDPRPQQEYDAWMAKDPIKRVATQLDSKTTKKVDKNTEAELVKAIDFARAGAEPDIESVHNAVYAPHADYPPAPKPNGRILRYTEALNEALNQEMARDDKVLVMGEDVGETGGIFTVTTGLMDQFGADRVRDTPISEPAFVGCGIGAAIAGYRPVVEIQIFDFVALTMDMLVNQAAKFRFMLGGKDTVPLVVRGPQGGGVRLAAQHSQSLEAWFTHVPGLVVVAPSTPYDAKGLLVAAIRDDNPVIFLEAKLLYMTEEGPVPEELYALPIGKADVKHEGSDVTVVATLAMVPRALAAAEQLEREGISVEVIDPRTLRPLDEETILNSVRKTGRLLIAHEAWVSGGFGAEVAAIVADKALMDLDAPIKRIGSPDVPMPYNDELERAVIPSKERLVEVLRELANF